MTPPAAIILCGGRSRRMGRPKAWLPFGTERLIQRVVRIASEVCDPIVVVAAQDQELPTLPPSVLVVRDPVGDRGPLQGLAAGLLALPDSVEFAYVSATDVPFLDPAWISRLVALIGPDDLAIAEVGGHLHPLSALYRRAAALPAAESLLRADRFRVLSLVEILRSRVLGPEEMGGPEVAAMILRNVNTMEEYREALAGPGRDAEAIGRLISGNPAD